MYTFTQQDLYDLLQRVDKNVAKYSIHARESMLQTITSFFKKRQSWISINDELPKHKLMVQIGNSFNKTVSEAQYINWKWFEYWDPRCLTSPTHWQEIPLPPV